MNRSPGLSVRARLTLSYAGFLMVAGVALLGVVWLFLLRYVPPDAVISPTGQFVPGRDDLIRAFVPAAAWALVCLLILGLVGGRLLAGRMLAPLTRIAKATRKVRTGSLSHRIEMEGRRDEFRDLADSFDAMLAQVEAHVSQQQLFAANASHELRTPLAVIQTLLEVARNDPNRDSAELIERLLAVNARAIELIEALLLLSRADNRSFARQIVDLSLLAEEASETLLPLAERHGVLLQTTGEITPVQGSRALLQQMITNLVHNAIVHNLAQRGTVHVNAASENGIAELTVRNTGPTLAPEAVSRLSEPFRRGADRIRTHDAGVGLGLAIVQSIVRAHDGSLTITPQTSGGLCVTVKIPATDRPTA